MSTNSSNHDTTMDNPTLTKNVRALSIGLKAMRTELQKFIQISQSQQRTIMQMQKQREMDQKQIQQLQVRLAGSGSTIG